MGKEVFITVQAALAFAILPELQGFQVLHGFITIREAVVSSCPAAVCEPTLIELVSFTATPKAGKVILQWSTESEIDNAGFKYLPVQQQKTVNMSNKQFHVIPAEGQHHTRCKL